MTTRSQSTSIATWMATIIIVGGLVALVFVAPVVAAIAFVGLAVLFAIGVGQQVGKLKGLVSFLRDVLFGW